MRKMVTFTSLTVGSGLLVGAGIVGWLYYTKPESTVAVRSDGKAIDLLSVSGSQDAAEASPTPSPTQGGSLSIATPTPAPKSLPGPTGFGDYEQYKSAEAALYADFQVGTGEAVAAGSSVTVNYRGWLTNGQEFDESYQRGKPFTFVEGQHQVIAGWEVGLYGMKAGGKRRLIIPPAQGYGDQAQGAIPAGSVLVFDVELVSVMPGS